MTSVDVQGTPHDRRVLAVSVVVPTYNRAHLLPTTLPTYIQPGVQEVIIVDDGSSDDTPGTVERLALKYPLIKYYRLERNSGQAAAKNVGISLARSPYVFFGDDDSLLVEGSILALAKCLEDWCVDIAGARAVYMLPGESVEDALRRTRRGRREIVDIQRLRAYFDDDPGRPVRVPFCPACCLLPTELARAVRFDPVYSGSGYREETDFLLRCAESGAKIIFCPQAVSVNLPREAAAGGAWARKWFAYECSAIRNNWHFLRRHYEHLAREWGLRTPQWFLQCEFILDRVSFRARSVAKWVLGPQIVAAIRKRRLGKAWGTGSTRR